MLRITRYAALFVDRFPDALIFYKNVLGLEPVRSNSRSAEFDWNGNRLFIEQGKNSGKAKGNFHLEFEADDFKESLQMLLLEGCEAVEF